MKISIQPTHLPDAAEAVTVNCHEDDGTEVVLFNAVVTRADGRVTLAVVHSTRAWPDHAACEATGATLQKAGEQLVECFHESAPDDSADLGKTSPPSAATSD